MGSNPGLIPGKVPTAAEWNSYFSAKQDDLGFAPLSTGGGVLTGELTYAPATTSAASFNVPPGTAPSSPSNGDMWSTASGLFVRIAGSTVNLSGGIVTSFAGGTLTGKLFTAPSTSSISGLNITPGGNPSSTVEGDIWVTSHALYCQLGGVPVFISGPAQLPGLPLKASPAGTDYLLAYDNVAGQLSKVLVQAVGPPDVDNPLTAPTYTSLLSGSGTYNTPASCVRLRVRPKAGGGGGGAEFTNSGQTGQSTSFGGWTAVGGSGGQSGDLALLPGSGGTGGTNSTGTLVLRRSGCAGQGGNFQTNATIINMAGGMGGGGVGGGAGGASGLSAPANSGFGGGGAGGANPTGTASASSGAGGGEGEEVEFIIFSPSASYAYTVGNGGGGGAAGGQAGGNGGSGRILIEEFYY